MLESLLKSTVVQDRKVAIAVVALVPSLVRDREVVITVDVPSLAGRSQLAVVKSRSHSCLPTRSPPYHKLKSKSKSPPPANGAAQADAE